MTEEEQMHTGGGISRRDIMKRSAVVGGAMVWATPLVQTMARPAFAQVGTPEFVNSSFVALVINCDDDDDIRVKWESNDEKDDGEFVDPGPDECPHTGSAAECICEMEETWTNATKDSTGAGITFTISDDGSTVTFNLPEGCTFVDGRAKDGSDQCREAGEDVGTSTASVDESKVTFKF